MPVRKILVAFDGSEAAYRALEQAIESAQVLDAQIDVVTVRVPPPRRARAADALWGARLPESQVTAARRPDQRLAAVPARTTSTDADEWCRTRRATLPRTRRRSPVCPREPTTIRSASKAWAAASTSPAGSPTRSSALASMPSLLSRVADDAAISACAVRASASYSACFLWTRVYIVGVMPTAKGWITWTTLTTRTGTCRVIGSDARTCSAASARRDPSVANRILRIVRDRATITGQGALSTTSADTDPTRRGDGAAGRRGEGRPAARREMRPDGSGAHALERLCEEAPAPTRSSLTPTALPVVIVAVRSTAPSVVTPMVRPRLAGNRSRPRVRGGECSGFKVKEVIELASVQEHAPAFRAGFEMDPVALERAHRGRAFRARVDGEGCRS